MGCCGSSTKEEQIDNKVLGDFLNNDKNLRAVWNQFNKDDDEFIDVLEFRNLLYRSLVLFCKERDPNIQAPSREAMEPFVEKLRKELLPKVDTNSDGQISFEEFKTFGQYLKDEYGQLAKENKDNEDDN